MDRWKIFEKDIQLSKDVGTGLWILPSYFNHSCVDQNIFWFFLGDLMFVRSLRPISKGEELVLSYYLIHDYEERSRSLKSVGIDCQCRLCKLDRSESQEIKLQRANILETYKKSIRSRESFIASNVDSFFIKRSQSL